MRTTTTTTTDPAEIPPSPSDTRVLLADGDEQFLATASAYLSGAGLAVDFVPDADAARQRLALVDDGYDVLVAAVDMPGNADLAFAREVARRYPRLPVILVTAQPSFESAVQAIELPVVAYLVKPLAMPSLLDQVRCAAARSQLFRSIANLRRELAACDERLAAVDAAARGSGAGPGAMRDGAHAFATVALHSIHRGLRHVVTALGATTPEGDEAGTSQPGEADSASSRSDPPDATRDERLQVAKAALAATVTTLERTKSSFKSKELGVLRRELEQVLRVLEV